MIDVNKPINSDVELNSLQVRVLLRLVSSGFVRWGFGLSHEYFDGLEHEVPVVELFIVESGLEKGTFWESFWGISCSDTGFSAFALPSPVHARSLEAAAPPLQSAPRCTCSQCSCAGCRTSLSGAAPLLTPTLSLPLCSCLLYCISYRSNASAALTSPLLSFPQTLSITRFGCQGPFDTPVVSVLRAGMIAVTWRSLAAIAGVLVFCLCCILPPGCRIFVVFPCCNPESPTPKAQS